MVMVAPFFESRCIIIQHCDSDLLRATPSCDNIVHGAVATVQRRDQTTSGKIALNRLHIKLSCGEYRNFYFSREITPTVVQFLKM